jgi:hypothetical protein
MRPPAGVDIRFDNFAANRSTARTEIAEMSMSFIAFEYAKLIATEG